VSLAPAGARGFVAVPGLAGPVLLAAALALRAAALMPWGLGASGGAYAAGLIAAGAGLDPAAPLVAGALVLAAELAYWSLEEQGGRVSRKVVARRTALAALVALATAGAGAILLGFGEVRPAGGPLVLGAGLAAAVAATALIARLAVAAGRR
jgi:hypothetical protein